MTTADKIKIARKAAGLTQKELGERMGVSDASITQYESGKRNPKARTIKRIAEALNISEMDIIGDDEFSAMRKTIVDAVQFSTRVLERHEENTKRIAKILDNVAENDPILFDRLTNVLDGASLDEINMIAEIGKVYRSLPDRNIKGVVFEFEDETHGDAE